MGKLVLGQRLDLLAGALAEEIAERATSPLQRQRVFVPKGQMRSWLLLELAKNGIVSGVEVLTLREWLAKDLPTFWELASAIYLELLKGEEEEIAAYLQKNGAMDLAEHLALLFEEYGEYAPQFFSEGEDWQRRLFRKVFESLRAPVQLSLQKISAYFFGIDFVAPCYWKFFSDVSVYLFSPCVHFWEDVCSDWEKRGLSRYWKKRGVSGASLRELGEYLGEAPLPLANWGRLGREMLKVFGEWEVEECYEDVEATSLLKRVQSSLLYFETGKIEWSEDRSLRVFQVGSSRFREVEVLCEEILVLAREEGLLFSEMAVLAPDVNEYAPLVELLFSRFQIPYQIVGVEIGSKSFFLQGFYRLLDVLAGEWNEGALCALFETPSFYRCLEWDGEMLERGREWISVAMHAGLEELVRGLVVFSSELSIEMGDAEGLARFIAVFQALSGCRIEGEKTVVEWASCLEGLVGRFLVCNEEEASDLAAWTSFQQLLRELRKTHASLERGAFSFEWVRRWIKRPIHGQVHSAHLHAVSIGSFSEGNLTCKRALFLLGMDEESFPKRRVSSSLNLLKKEKLYFPESVDWDRYLFLRALFSAKEFLRISYGHISREEGKPIGPSPVVEELLLFAGQEVVEQRRGQNREMQKSGSFFKGPPSFALPEGEWVVSLADLSLLMRHPWKFYLRKTLGIRLEERGEPSFQLKKEILSRTSLTESIETRLSKELPRGIIGEALSLEVRERGAEWKKLLPGPLFSVQFLQSCREKKEGEVPCLEISIGEKTRVQVVGEIRNLSSGMLVYPGKDDLKGLLRVWPEWLCAAYALDVSQVLCLKSEKMRSLQNPQQSLERLLRYFFAAQSAPSPLLLDWADAFLLKKKIARKGEDPVFDWVAARSEVPPMEAFEREWGAFLRGVFEELIDADV